MLTEVETVDNHLAGIQIIARFQEELIAVCGELPAVCDELRGLVADSGARHVYPPYTDDLSQKAIEAVEEAKNGGVWSNDESHLTVCELCNCDRIYELLVALLPDWGCLPSEVERLASDARKYYQAEFQ